MTDCPHPAKRIYPSHDTAVQAMAGVMRRRRTRYAFVRAYLCKCGSWHLTSRAKRGRR